MKTHRFLITIIFLTAISCQKNESISDKAEIAKSYFHAVYTGELEKVDSIIADSILSSYPIFQQLTQGPAIQGREDFISFQSGFHERWKETRVSIHKTISENNDVVIMWSFKGIWSNTDTTITNSFEFGEEYTWGGISIVTINESGKIIREVGEESSPGPFIRLGGILGEK